GSIVALATPFAEDGVDWAALDALVEWHIAEGTHGFVPVGTTGETPVLSHEEHEAVVARVVKVVNRRVPVIAGAGSNSTREAVRLTRHAAASGADAARVVAPYYNKPTQEGMFAHFKAVHDAAEIPIILYNVPGRTVADLSVETVARLAELPRITGIKDATADLTRPSLTRLEAGTDFIQLSGEDGTALAFNAHGGVGCISVTANVAPKLCAQFQEACLRGDYAEALTLQDKLMPLHKALFFEASPAPTKYALSLLGKCSDAVRLPLVAATEACRGEVRAAMAHAGVLNG
ncbi:MAG: 4-hydroxy-tetrahydrodipicolinate synthase, partial [Rhodobacteraceae bacterium]|nr:4-hydroxy-tetrahydrodipicolinate synthase [Paracoccaceae bacterium]